MRTINQSTALTTLIERALPSHSGVVKYNHSSQMYETERYVSAAGNAYFRGLKISDRVVLEFCCGDGIWHRFINCIRIYCFNGNEKQLIASQPYSCQFYSEEFCRRECIRLLSNYLKSQAELVGGVVEDSTIQDFAKQLVAATNQKLIA